MRLALIGRKSFIAAHVARVAAAAGAEVLQLSQRGDFEKELQGADTIANFALHPDFQSAPYVEDKDLDLKAARAVSKSSTHFIMLSTRRVYPGVAKWGASENTPATGDETIYGQNKAKSETAVRAAVGEKKLTILRLSNIIGFEYDLERPRKTFMATALRRLRAEREISFDMSPDTGRDFLPVEVCADAIFRIARTGMGGIFNVGSGFATPCGDVAKAVLKGFEAGELVVTRNEIRDAFYLNTNRWKTAFTPLQTPQELIDYCESLGRKLRDA